MTITRNVAGMELKIELTEEEIKQIVTECAMITVKPLTAVLAAPVTEPASKPESETPAKQYTMPKVIRTGCFKDHKDEVIEMRRQGYSCARIAEYFGVAEATVKKWTGVWDRCQSFDNNTGTYLKGLTMKDAKEMLDAMEQGAHRADLAIKYNVSVNTIEYWLRKARTAKAA